MFRARGRFATRGPAIPEIGNDNENGQEVAIHVLFQRTHCIKDKRESELLEDLEFPNCSSLER